MMTSDDGIIVNDEEEDEKHARLPENRSDKRRAWRALPRKEIAQGADGAHRSRWVANHYFLLGPRKNVI
jgi:hypothetical protein